MSRYSEARQRRFTSHCHSLISLLHPRRHGKASYLLYACVLLFILSFLLLRHRQLLNPHTFHSPADLLSPTSGHAFDRAEGDLHILIPASQPDPELCKALLSAHILSYPVPTLINWNKTATILQADPEAKDWRYNGTHIAKITGALQYLEHVLPEHGNQLVLLVDGYDTVFQLPADILKARYRAENRVLMERTLQQLGSAAVATENITQGVLFSAQKNCGPLREQWQQIGCYAQPESLLPADIYGPDTDTLDPESHLPLKLRPHFLCSGLVLGPVHDVQSMLYRAKDKIHSTEHKGSDQFIFNEIFGEQQYQRQVIRKRHRSFFSRMSDAFAKVIGAYMPTLLDSPLVSMESLDGAPLDFGIGLDYRLQISQSAVLSEFDGRFNVYNDTDALRKAAGPPTPPVATTLPTDIAESKTLPFERLYFADDHDVQAWADLPLYTNIWTGGVPVTIHMNGFKGMRNSLWSEMWFYSRAKEWLNIEALRSDGHRVLIAKDDDGKPLYWDSICRQYEPEVLGEHILPQG